MKRKSAFALILVLLLLLLIWGNSLLPSQQSYVLSDSVSRLLTRLHLERLVNWLVFLGRTQSSRVRKAAHLAEFALFGFALAAYLSRWKAYGRVKALLIAFCGVLTALLDETLQLISSRTSSVRDIWIDLAGYAFGALFSLLTVRLLKLLRGVSRKREAERD